VDRGGRIWAGKKGIWGAADTCMVRRELRVLALDWISLLGWIGTGGRGENMGRACLLGGC